MIANLYGKLFNEGGELVGEGACQVDDERGSVTLRPSYDMPLLERQHGLLRLTLEDGSELTLSDRVIRFRMNLPGAPPGAVYRLFLNGQQRLTQWPHLPGQEERGTSNQGPGPGGPDEIPPELRK
jgi:hypothetical protein